LVATLKLISDISASWVARPGRDWLLGPAPSLADMQLAPILHFIRQTPEGRSAMAQCELLSAWWSRVMERTWLEAVLRSGDVG